jgi:signal transduction histidine kinase
MPFILGVVCGFTHESKVPTFMDVVPAHTTPRGSGDGGQTREGTPRDEGLRARVLAVIEESADTLGIAPRLRMDGLLDTRVSERLADQLVAAPREALANVAKHARASRVEVVVSVNGGLLLRVRDDGVGIAPTGRRSGLRNLSMRAQELQGELSVDAAEGGTVLKWRVPLSPHP